MPSIEQMTATLRKIFTTAGEDFATTNEVAKALATLVVGLKGVREKAQEELAYTNGALSEKIKAVVRDVDSSERRLKELVSSNRRDASGEMKSIAADLRKEMSMLENMIPDAVDMEPIRQSMRDMEERMRTMHDNMPMPTAAQMRDALESLKGDDRLDVSAIRGLEEFVKKNGGGPRSFFGGSGLPVVIKDRGTILSKRIRVINFLGTEANVNAGGDEVTIEPIVVSDTAPSSPFEGQLWVDTS